MRVSRDSGRDRERGSTIFSCSTTDFWNLPWIFAHFVIHNSLFILLICVDNNLNSPCPRHMCFSQENFYGEHIFPAQDRIRFEQEAFISRVHRLNQFAQKLCRQTRKFLLMDSLIPFVKIFADTTQFAMQSYYCLSAMVSISHILFSSADSSKFLQLSTCSRPLPYCSRTMMPSWSLLLQVCLYVLNFRWFSPMSLC